MRQSKTLALVLLLTTAAAAQVFRHGRFERSFEAANHYANPLQDVEVRVEFTGPEGVQEKTLAFWDGTPGSDPQFLKAFGWNGKELTPAFEVDFLAEKLGRPHIMNFGQIDFYKGRVAQGSSSGAR